MINAILDDLRRNKRYKQTQRPTETDIIDFHNTDVTWNDFEHKTNADDLLAMIRQLPDATRDVFCLYGIDGFKHHEIATMLGISEGTSKWHVSEARKRLIVMLTNAHNPATANGKR
jgi:RNA polymerase sigma factor (sigma-70 family)